MSSFSRYKDVKISSHVLEFMKRDANFSDLQLKEKGHGEIWISLNEKQLSKLINEMNKVLCQSYLLDNNQYEVLWEEKTKVLLDIEKHFQVKGYPYQLPVVANVPQIFHLNQLTRISCVEDCNPENIPLDYLISVEKEPQFGFCSEKTHKIVQNDSWNLCMNHHITLSIQKINKKKDWNFIFGKCLKEVSKNRMLPHTIGISIHTEISEYLVEFCQGILTAANDFLQIYNRPIYILLFVKTFEKLMEVNKILKNVAVPESEPEKISSGTAAEECIVDVIEGLITDQKVDVIVSTSEMTMNLTKGAVASALLRKAGQELQDECNECYPHGIIFPEIAVIKGYKLLCHSVFFGALPSNNKKPNIYTFMKNCLLRAADKGFSSIAFPVLGTGNLGYTPKEAAIQMTSAIAEYMDGNHSLKKIIIVIYPSSKSMKPLFELKETFAKTKDSKGAVPKKKPKSQQHNQWSHVPNMTYDQLQWISFLDYSKKDNLYPAIMEYEKYLSDSKALKRNIASTPNQPKQKYTEVTNNNSSFFKQDRIDSFNQAAKNNENISSPSVQFITNKPKYPEFDRANMRPSYIHKSKRTRVFVSYYQENKDIHCFKADDDFLVKVYEGDILKVNVDGIVNAANKWLTHGGGLAAAIIKAAGDTVDREGQAKLNGRQLSDGEVLSTSAGYLKHYKYIIHAVGPVYTTFHDADDYCRRKITETVYNALEAANQLGLCSVALPAISSAIFGVPLNICAEGYFLGVEEFYKRKPSNCQLVEVHFVDLNSNTCKIIKDYFIKQLNEATLDIDDDNSLDIPMKEDFNYVYKAQGVAGSDSKETVEYSDNDYGNQPSGTMDINETELSLLGYTSRKRFYEIKYTLSNSYQKNQPISKLAYLPVTEEGGTILKMLQMAFERHLIFKESEGSVSWADIPHKISLWGDLEKDGCLSPKYLEEVKASLAKKGITPEAVAGRKLQNQIVSE